MTHDSRRFVGVFPSVRYFRDSSRHLALCARIEDGLISLEQRVRSGRLTDPAKIGAAAGRVLRSSPVGPCCVVNVKKGFFSWDFDEKARHYDEELLCGRYVITTSLSATEASVALVVRSCGSLESVERRSRVMKDFLSLRPMLYWSEERVCDRVGPCVLAATIEAVMAKDLVKAKVIDPDLPFQS
jgi:hypothetical protein